MTFDDLKQGAIIMSWTEGYEAKGPVKFLKYEKGILFVLPLDEDEEEAAGIRFYQDCDFIKVKGQKIFIIALKENEAVRWFKVDIKRTFLKLKVQSGKTFPHSSVPEMDPRHLIESPEELEEVPLKSKEPAPPPGPRRPEFVPPRDKGIDFGSGREAGVV